MEYAEAFRYIAPGAAGHDAAVHLDDQVVMRGHQHVRDARPADLSRRPGKKPQPDRAVDVVSEERRSRPDAVRVDVEDSGRHIAVDVGHRPTMAMLERPRRRYSEELD